MSWAVISTASDADIVSISSVYREKVKKYMKTCLKRREGEFHPVYIVYMLLITYFLPYVIILFIVIIITVIIVIIIVIILLIINLLLF